MKAEEFDFLELNSRWVKRRIYCLLCTATVRHNYIGNYIYIYMDISNWEWPTIWFKKEGSDFKINLQHNYSIVLRITITSILIMGGPYVPEPSKLYHLSKAYDIFCKV